MAKPFHFIRFKQQRLLYGRVPKAAKDQGSNVPTPIRGASQNKPRRRLLAKSNQQSDRADHARPSPITFHQIHFSFVRNPFDRLIAAYNNKVIEINEPPLPMQKMGITHGMPFEAFLDVLIHTPFKQFDVHVLPQSNTLHVQSLYRSSGRVEQIDDHWAKLRTILANHALK